MLGDNLKPVSQPSKIISTTAGPRVVKIAVSPEAVFSWAIRLLIFGYVLCGLITFLYIKPDLANDPIVRVYGTVNICITFDYQPSRSIMALLMMPMTALLAAYAVLFHYRIRLFFPRGSKIRSSSPWLCSGLIVTFGLKMLSIINTPDVSVKAHTLPFQGLIVGQMIWWYYVLIVVQNWPAKFNQKVITYYRTITGVMIAVSVIKIYGHWVLLSVEDGKLTFEEADIMFPAWLRPIPDPIWMLCVLGFRYWCPLSGCEVELLIASASNKSVSTDAGDNDDSFLASAGNICCWRVLPEGGVEKIGFNAVEYRSKSGIGGLREGAAIDLINSSLSFESEGVETAASSAGFVCLSEEEDDQHEHVPYKIPLAIVDSNQSGLSPVEV